MMEVLDFSQAWLRLATDLMGFTQENLEVKERLSVCAKCTHRVSFKCGVCSCPLKAKVRSKNNCPKEKW